MTDILFQIFIEPLVLLFEYLYTISQIIIGHHRLLVLIPMSLAVNLICLPLYHRADAIRNETLALERRMKPGLEHIKKVFRGNEKYMMQMAYYRINHYSPISTIRNSLSLLLQVPFFFASYLVISSIPAFRGLLGPINSIADPDGLFSINSFRVNVLPILMTSINLVSGAIYTKGGSVSDKIQVFGIALVFLVLLYNSPAALVIYWIFNQCFSLAKNIWDRWRPARTAQPIAKIEKKEIAFLLWGLLLLVVLTGVLIPSAVIHSSPEEFTDIEHPYSPLRHVFYAACLSFGVFVVWGGLVYYLSGARTRKILSVLVWIMSGLALINYMFFGLDFGTLSPLLKYDVTPSVTSKSIFINLTVLTCIAVGLYLIYRLKNSAVRPIQLLSLVVIIGMSAFNCFQINRNNAVESDIIKQNAEKNHFSYPLSRQGKNVIIVMMDRAVGAFVPYVLRDVL